MSFAGPEARFPGARSPARQPEKGRRSPPSEHSAPAVLHAAVLDVQRAAGNQAAISLIQRDAAAATAGTTDDIAAAEAWVLYIAMRETSAAPTQPVPGRFKPLIDTLQNAVGGSPASAVPGLGALMTAANVKAAEQLLSELRAEHDKRTPHADHQAFDIAKLALERVVTNMSGGAESAAALGAGDSSPTGAASQADYNYILLSIQQEAEDELEEAKAAGYIITDALRTLPQDAAAMLATARQGQGKGPTAKPVSPAEEQGLVLFAQQATEIIMDLRERRAADMARARRAEAAALEAAADRELAQLRDQIAERRRTAFMSGGTEMKEVMGRQVPVHISPEEELKKLRDALGEVNSAISDTKKAAGLITSKVDKINYVLSLAGKKTIQVPKLPKGVTDVVEHLKTAQEKLDKVLELLDLAGPAKTEFEGGLKYLEGEKDVLEMLGGSSPNPFVSGYINHYLGPGIKNCIESLRSIEETTGTAERAAIGAGLPQYVGQWKAVTGGESMYGYLVFVHQNGPGSPINDGALNFFNEHRAAISAAVGEDIPTSGESLPMVGDAAVQVDRDKISPWVLHHFTEIWQTFYGATPIVMPRPVQRQPATAAGPTPGPAPAADALPGSSIEATRAALPTTAELHPGDGPSVDVGVLQQRLNALAPLVPRVVVSGMFDAPTEVSLRAFQAEFGIPVTGITDGTTWLQLNSMAPSVERNRRETVDELRGANAVGSPLGAVSHPVLRLHSRGTAVQELQEKLFQVPGVPRVTVDGTFNPETRAAVLEFQRANPPLDADGVVGANTWAAIDAQATGPIDMGAERTRQTERVEGSEYIVEGNYGWHIQDSDHKMVITVNLQFTGHPGHPRVAGWMDDIRRPWNVFMFANRTRPDEHYELEFNPVLGGTPPDASIEVVVGNGRSNAGQFYTGDTSHAMAGHEFGHLIGLPDEYNNPQEQYVANTGEEVPVGDVADTYRDVNGVTHTRETPGSIAQQVGDVLRSNPVDSRPQRLVVVTRRNGLRQGGYARRVNEAYRMLFVGQMMKMTWSGELRQVQVDPSADIADDIAARLPGSTDEQVEATSVFLQDNASLMGSMSSMNEQTGLPADSHNHPVEPRHVRHFFGLFAANRPGDWELRFR